MIEEGEGRGGRDEEMDQGKEIQVRTQNEQVIYRRGEEIRQDKRMS